MERRIFLRTLMGGVSVVAVSQVLGVNPAYASRPSKPSTPSAASVPSVASAPSAPSAPSVASAPSTPSVPDDVDQSSRSSSRRNVASRPSKPSKPSLPSRPSAPGLDIAEQSRMRGRFSKLSLPSGPENILRSGNVRDESEQLDLLAEMRARLKSDGLTEINEKNIFSILEAFK